MKGGKDVGGIRGQHGHAHLIAGSNLPAGAASVYSAKLVGPGKHHRGNSVDALNASVEMRSKIQMIGSKQQKHVREQSVRISRFQNGGGIDGENSLLQNSVHDFERTKNKAADHLESLSVSGSHHQAKIKEVSKEVYIRKDRDLSKSLTHAQQQ